MLKLANGIPAAAHVLRSAFQFFKVADPGGNINKGDDFAFGLLISPRHIGNIFIWYKLDFMRNFIIPRKAVSV